MRETFTTSQRQVINLEQVAYTAHDPEENEGQTAIQVRMVNGETINLGGKEAKDFETAFSSYTESRKSWR